MSKWDAVRRLSIQAVIGAVLVQAAACGFPRPADIEPDGGSVVATCGNSLIEPGEDCDDGNAIDDGNGCDNQCHKNAICGDGKIQTFFEVCDGTSGCSLDCKEASILSYPVSNSYTRYDVATQTWNPLFPESAPGGDVAWDPRPEDGGPFEWRAAFEFETRSLRPMDLLKAARFTAFAIGVTQQAPTLQLNGYLGDGAVAIPDMDTGASVSSVLVQKPGPMVFDVSMFIQQATSRKYAFTGFSLRVNKIASTDPFMGISVVLNGNSDPTVRPRLEIVYCVDGNRDGTCD